MASSDIVQYKTPARKAVDTLIGVFLTIYLVWTLLTFVMMFVSSFKDLLEAFKLPEIGDWLGVTLFFDFTPTFRHYENLFLDKNNIAQNQQILHSDREPLLIDHHLILQLISVGFSDIR